MFDLLTRDELYALHSKLHDEGLALHLRFMGLPSATGEEALVLLAKHAEISETMKAVYAEIDRREQDAICRTCGFSDCPGARGGDCPRWPGRDAGTRALRDLRNQRGIDA